MNRNTRNGPDVNAMPTYKPDLEGKLPQKGKNWRTLVVNANSLEEKIAETEWLISHTHPDLILITEM